MKIFIGFFLLFSLIYEGICFSNGQSSNICNEIILQQYNVKPTTCSSNFVIESSSYTYAVDEPISVTIRSAISDTTFIGIHLLAQNDKNINVGNWKTTSALLENNSCGGLMHSSNVEKNSVDAVWHASSNIAGDIMIKAIIIENDDTVYVDCYKIILSSRVFNNSTFTKRIDPPPNTTTTTFSTTTILTTTLSTTESTTTILTTTLSTTASTTTASTTTASTTTVSTTASTTITTTPSVTTTTTQSTTSILTTTSPLANTTLTPSPTTDVTINVTWTFNNENSVTSVIMTVTNLKSGEWAAIGLNLNESMDGAHVFMCKRFVNTTVVINRYINPGEHHHPEPIGSEDGGLMTPDQQQLNEGVVICRFNLSNFPNETLQGVGAIPPLSQSTKYHPIFAVGGLDANNNPHKHADDSRTVLSDLVQLNQNEVILYKVKKDDGESLTYLRAHGIIMVFTWIFFASTGILISRYFKTSWANTFICGKAVWFAAHRFIMSIVAILAIVGFLFIFAFAEGSWVPKNMKLDYAHSITGVITISLAFFQPFIALFRCEPGSSYRFIFNYLHAFIGFSTFILSIATLFVATYFELFSDNIPRTIMIIWIVWIVLIMIIFEYIKYYFRKKYGGSNYLHINPSTTTIGGLVEGPMSPTSTSASLDNQQEPPLEQRIKTVFLAIHILVAAILAIIFATRIA